ncbi:MAG TPA: glycosyltransferase [Bryobacteraceae bacterium]|nr:glycosyltransferase [Bryobacteraceae bacterium]
MRERLKSWLFRLLRKDPEAVVVTFLSGDPALVAKMAAEIRALVPERRHFTVPRQSGSAWQIYRRLRRQFRSYRIGLAPVLFTAEPDSLRLAAFLLAPRKILAYNARLERHHLRLRTAIASALFLRGVPLDRIFLRPRWLCPWKRDRSVVPAGRRIIAGRPLSPERRRVAVLSPYFPWPLAHGGAVRIFHLLREAAREFDIFLFAFTTGETEADCQVLAEFCARLILVEKPRYREPRWSTLLPPEVLEFRSPAMRQALAELRREYAMELLQVEYTQLASYGGQILVEHDVTFDLYQQIRARRPTLSAWWDCFRWRRFETRAVRRYPRVVAMSEKDARLLNASGKVSVIENGVDLARFEPVPERPGRRLLFVGSFRHFPNVAAFRFFLEEVWPRLRDSFPDLTLTVVAGPDPLLHWQNFTKRFALPADPRLQLLGFVADVRPLYHEANLVLVPTVVSAGTNVKVLEAMAIERAVVSTTSGCAGLGLEHAKTVWVADTPEDFAAGVARLLQDPQERVRIAQAARRHAEQHFSWEALGQKQRTLWRAASAGGE